MASTETLSSEQRAWNEAHARVTHFLEGFALVDRAHVARVALELVDQAREVCAKDKSRCPATVTMDLAHQRLTKWLATNLLETDKPASEILADGSIALLLSRVYQTAPDTFMAGPLPEELRHALRERLLIAGPDMNISRMTPRHLDYGPMLGLARQTWHRWDIKRIIFALLFWAAVYFGFYWWLEPYFQ